MDPKVVAGVFAGSTICCLFLLGIVLACIEGVNYLFQNKSVSSFINDGSSKAIGVALAIAFGFLFVIFLFKSHRSTDAK